MQKTYAAKSICFLIALSNLSHAYATESYPEIYPFVPYTTERVTSKVIEVAEDPSAILDIWSIQRYGLSSGSTSTQPWTSTYWPMNQGLVAGDYQNRNALNLRWKRSVRRFEHRRDMLRNWQSLSNSELDELAPSEKYDILLGDNSFRFTNIIWQRVRRWGSEKDHAFLNSSDFFQNQFEASLRNTLAREMVLRNQSLSLESAQVSAAAIAANTHDNYVLADRNSRMATWEGICHGWSLAAGVVDRPLHYVDIALPNGKRLRFLPDDIKALASVYFAHSQIQNGFSRDENGLIWGGVLGAGNRCNASRSEIKRDEWGRPYDSAPDPYTAQLEDRCSGVHPAIWHLALVNIIGKQHRSFVVERKVSSHVDNHPLKSYRFRYFNPYSGEHGNLRSVMRPLDNRDDFKAFRNASATHLVGIHMTMTYMDWKRPKGDLNDSESKDDTKDIDMIYDLELNEQGLIVGGQWRASRDGRGIGLRGNRNMPDFFWTISKDWESSRDFQTPENLEPWRNTQVRPPSTWLSIANQFMYHGNILENTGGRCQVRNRENGDVRIVGCTINEAKPKPLWEVIKKLVQLSRR